VFIPEVPQACQAERILLASKLPDFRDEGVRIEAQGGRSPLAGLLDLVLDLEPSLNK
jgi:hypothetical protein